MIKVRAKAPGFYQRLYSPGEVFSVPENRFSSEWMERMEEKKKPGRPKKEEAEGGE